MPVVAAPGPREEQEQIVYLVPPTKGDWRRERGGRGRG